MLRHELLRIHRPALDVRAVAENIAQQAARTRLHFIRIFALHVVTRHRLMHGQMLHSRVVVLAQLRIDARLRPRAWDRRHPEKCPQLRFQRRRRIEAADSVNTSHEHRRLDDLQIGVRRQGQQILGLDEGRRRGERLLGRRHVSRHRRMLASDIRQRLFRGLGRREPRDLRPRLDEIRLRFRQQRLGGFPRGQHQAKLFCVALLPQPPIARFLRQMVFQPMVEAVECRNGGCRGLVVPHALIGRAIGA